MTIPASYLDAGNLTHAYVMTVHAAQGMTAEVAFVLGDESVYREWGYRRRHIFEGFHAGTFPSAFTDWFWVAAPNPACNGNQLSPPGNTQCQI